MKSSTKTKAARAGPSVWRTTPIKNASDLSAAMKANLKSVIVAGGSAGGVDHIFSGVFARATRANPDDLTYLPFAGGLEVVSAVLSGKATVGISG